MFYHWISMYVYVRLSVVFTSLSLFLCYNQFCFMDKLTETLYVITKTSLYNFDPLKPHFYIVKLGLTWGIHYFSYFCSKT